MESTVCTVLRCRGHSVFLVQQHQHNRQWVRTFVHTKREANIATASNFSSSTVSLNCRKLLSPKSQIPLWEKGKPENSFTCWYSLNLSQASNSMAAFSSYTLQLCMYITVIKYPVGSKVLLQYSKAVKTGKIVRLWLLLIFVLSKRLLVLGIFATATLKTGLYLSTKEPVSSSAYMSIFILVLRSIGNNINQVKQVSKCSVLHETLHWIHWLHRKEMQG